ncbi:hypothetical protein D9M72_231500 [compost metagenome]
MKTCIWCGCTPGPQEPIAYLPGALRTASTRPLKSCAGTEGCTTMIVRVLAMSDTWRRSVRGS